MSVPLLQGSVKPSRRCSWGAWETTALTTPSADCSLRSTWNVAWTSKNTHHKKRDLACLTLFINHQLSCGFCSQLMTREPLEKLGFRDLMDPPPSQAEGDAKPWRDRCCSKDRVAQLDSGDFLTTEILLGPMWWNKKKKQLTTMASSGERKRNSSLHFGLGARKHNPDSSLTTCVHEMDLIIYGNAALLCE